MHQQVFITGSNGGIGQALCETFLKNGWKVIALDIHAKSKHNDVSIYLQVDLQRLSNDDEYRQVQFNRIKEFNISVLINNAAVQVLGKFEEYNFTDWRKTFSVNVDAVFLLSSILYDSLVINKGQIINIGSVHQQSTKRNFFAYASSKSALVGLTKSLAVEFGGKIRVNAVSPGAIHTSMLEEGLNNDKQKLEKLKQLHPSKTIGSTRELAQFIYSISSVEYPFLNGANICFDGGISSTLLDVDSWE